MAGPVAARTTAYEAGFVPHSQHLSPRPQGKVLAIPVLVPLKFLGRQPIVCRPELLCIGHVAAGAQELAQVRESVAPDREGLSDVAPHREGGGKEAIALLAGEIQWRAYRIVCLRNDFRDHRSRS